jgi:hypothetical protein
MGSRDDLKFKISDLKYAKGKGAGRMLALQRTKLESKAPAGGQRHGREKNDVVTGGKNW